MTETHSITSWCCDVFQCSVTCGWGRQVREVACRHEGDTFCDEETKPLTRRNCTTNFPCYDRQGQCHRQAESSVRSSP